MYIHTHTTHIHKPIQYTITDIRLYTSTYLSMANIVLKFLKSFKYSAGEDPYK